MILSKNAVGNLINRYKAVLGKCRLINTFGSLALAAALALGSAGLAAAAQYDSADDWTGEVSIDGDVTVNTFFPENTPGENITAKSITLGAGNSLTLKGGARLINGIPGSDGDAPERLAFVMTGGELALGGTGDTYADAGINASINAKSVDISGGTVDITGKAAPSNWYQAAQLGGYRGLTVSGGTINMNSYSQMFGGGAVGAQFTGGIINMLGSDTATEVGNSAAHIMFGGSGANLIAGTAVINVGTDSADGYGVITTGSKVNMTGGSINVQNGELLLQPDVNDNTVSTSIIYDGNATGAFNQTGGTVTIADNGNLNLNKNVTYTLSGSGVMGLEGTINVTDAKMDLREGTFTNVTGGTINILRKSTPESEMARVEMKDSQLEAFIENGGTISVKGADIAGAPHYARLHLNNETANTAALKTNYFSKTAALGQIFLDQYGSVQAQNTELNGDALDIDTDARIKTNNLTLVPISADKDFVLTSGELFLKGETGSALNFVGTDGNGLTISSAGKLTLGDTQDHSPTASVIEGGVLNTTITSSGTVNVAQGTWALDKDKTLDITGGNLTVNGTLDVTPGALKTASGVTAKITSGGKVLANDTALDIDKNAWTSTNIEEAITVEGGGTLKVDGLDALSLAQIKDLKTNLMTGAGLFDAGDATITDIATGDTVAYDDVHALGNTTINALRNATVTDVTGDLSGAYAKVLLKDTFSGDLVADNTTLQLTGSKGGSLVSDSTGMAADVSVDGTGTLMLGDADSNNSGSLGNVNLGADGSLLALGNGKGNFNVGDITATAPNQGIVNVSGATLTAGGIGSTSTAINSVSANNGTLKATGGIYAGTVTATNGSISAKGDIALTGAASVTGGSLSADNITAASVSAIDAAVTAKTLTASADVTVVNGALTATGTDANASSVAGELTLTDSQANLGDMTVTGATAVTGGSLKAQSLTVGTDSTFTNGAKVNVGSLDANGKVITVGQASDTKSTSLVAETLTLGGGSLLIDPDWTADGPNTVTALSIGAANIDGNVGVGQNSMLTIGDTSSNWLHGQINAVTNGAGLTQNGVTAALGLKEAQVLGDNSGTGYSLVVDGSLDSIGLAGALVTSKTATFADNSLLVVTAAAAKNADGALSATTATSAFIGDSAKLRITDAKVGQEYTVLGANIAANSGGTGITLDTNKTGWTGSNFSTDSRMIKGSFDAASGVLTASLNSSANIYPKLDGELVAVLDNAYTADEVGPAHVNSDVKGVRFLSRATNDNFIGANSDLAAKTIESAARIAVAGAVPQMAMAANNAAGAAITQRTSIAQPDGNGMQSVSLNKADGVNKKGAALWIMPLYQGQNAWGMEAGNFDLKWHGGLGGVALGGDYTFDNALRAGIAFNIGGGYAEGEGDLAKTTNSFNFWGLGAYAGWAVENFGITADVNYTSTYNKVKQELPGAMQMRDLKSDITAYALSSGLRAEYKFNTQYVDIIPHLGVRYMYVNTDSYDVKSNGTVMHGDETSQNIWTFPIGVTFSKQVETGNGWYVKPSLDLGVLPATGDIDAKSKIRFTGTGTKAELDTRTMDYMSYTGGLGLDFGNNNLSFGLNYNIQASEHTTSHGVFGTARYEF